MCLASDCSLVLDVLGPSLVPLPSTAFVLSSSVLDAPLLCFTKHSVSSSVVDIVLYSSLLRVVLLSDVPLVFSTVFDALLYCSPISRLSASLAPDFTFTDFRCFFRFASFSLFRVSFRLSEQCCHDHSLLYHSPLSRAFLVRMARIFSRFMLVLNCRK